MNTAIQLPFRLLLLLCSVQCLLPRHTQAQADSVLRSVNTVHQEIWRRFVNPRFNILYDYTNAAGDVVIPSKAEVLALKPNGLSYTTVIEDGAFYNGLYLDALCNRYKKLQTAEAARKARDIAGGLIKLATVSKAPGFIARNILPDGETYYPASSDDQTFPWFYGMWKYLRSGIPDKREYEVIRQLILNKATALQRYNWDIPCDPIEFGYYGSFSRAGNKHLVRIPFITRIAFELSGDIQWKHAYHKSLEEAPSGEKVIRLELLAKGIEYGLPGDNKFNFWLSASSQAAIRELLLLETDPRIRSAYHNALRKHAVSAIPHMKLYRQFDNNHQLVHQTDWRYLNRFWKPQANCQEARVLGLDQVHYGYLISPAGPYEFDYMTEPLFAAWVIVLSGEEKLVESLLPDLRKALTHYRWSSIHHATIFIAEAVYYEGLDYGL